MKTMQACVLLPTCTPANSLQDLRGHWIKVHNIFIKRRRIIGRVNAIIRVAMLPSPNSCRISAERMKNEVCVCVSILANTRDKSVAVETSLD